MKTPYVPGVKEQGGGALRRAFGIVIAMSLAAVVMAGILVFPLVLGRLFTPEIDYSRISDIGQAYGAASAIISALALGVVVLGQHRQVRRARLQTLSAMNDELVRLAMDEPMYRQCWGARMAPDDVDEALFYYCNLVIKSWKIDWELRNLSEAQARAYLTMFFRSEIPRLFWQQHGDVQMKARLTNRKALFVVMINEEYLRAIHAGPPTRAREFCRPAKRPVKSSRRHLVDADNINERPTVP